MQPSLLKTEHILRAAAMPVALLLLLALPGPRAIQAADQSVQLAPGQRTTVQLEENPTTGYRWQIDRAGSADLAIVRIDDLGFSAREGAAPVGAPGSAAGVSRACPRARPASSSSIDGRGSRRRSAATRFRSR